MHYFPSPIHANNQRGVSLIMVMMIIVIVSLLGISGAQISTLAERSARNDRDAQMAWQGAEAALVDAEFDMAQAVAIAGSKSTSRSDLFGINPVNAKGKKQGGQVTATAFLSGCGAAGQNRGLCAFNPDAGAAPAWLTVDFAGDKGVPYGLFSGRSFTAGPDGIQPFQTPRYLIEAIPDTGQGSRDLSNTATKFVFRVTGIGFGPREDIQSVAQMIFRN